MQKAYAERASSVRPLDRISTLTGRLPAAGAVLFGLVILYFVGFSNFPQAHSAAHDTRHANGFPCH